MSALIAIQDAMQDWLLQRDAGLAALVDAGDATHRLRIYADAYRLRLVEVLGNDFPATKAALGDAGFDALAADYLQAHPAADASNVMIELEAEHTAYKDDTSIRPTASRSLADANARAAGAFEDPRARRH